MMNNEGERGFLAVASISPSNGNGDAAVVNDVAIARFWGKVDKQAPNGCWEWRGYTFKGYGRLWFEGRTRSAHRVSLALNEIEMPDGLHVDHLCRNRACVNPAHLRMATPRENVLAEGSESIAAVNASKTHCKYGHPFAGDNLYMKPRGRHCRECVRIYMKNWHRSPKGRAAKMTRRADTILAKAQELADALGETFGTDSAISNYAEDAVCAAGRLADGVRRLAEIKEHGNGQ